MCPIDKLDRPKKSMDMDLFKRIVNECVASGVKCLKLHNYGEPLLTPGFHQMLRHIRTRSSRIDIQFSTNGSLLDQKWAHVLVQENVNRVHITVDGLSKETYEKIRIGLKYDTVTSNILSFAKLKKQLGAKYPEIYVEIIEMEQNKTELDQFVRHWKGSVDHVSIKQYSTRAGELPGNEFTVQPRPCFRLWKQMVITNTGKVAMCCADWNCRFVLGDVKTHSLSQVWQGDVVRRLRHLHLQGRTAEIPLCKNCNPASWDSFPKWWFKPLNCKGAM
jgi:radical SAM protein with 4Fe4S-binding SPASM domain